MSAPDQLALFEPKGVDLANLAHGHARTAESHRRIADTLALQNFLASASAHTRLALLADQAAQVCELALLFESLAGVGEGA